MEAAIMQCNQQLDQNCTGLIASEMDDDVDWLEQRIVGGFRRWHVIFLTAAGIQAIVTFFCCCFRIRIPRTKMEIEADYRRKMLAKKFRQKLKIIQNIEMDEMDLKKALDRIRAEFRSDTESLAQSEAGLSLPDDGPFADGVSLTATYQRGSQMTLGFSLEDLQQEVQMTPLRRMSTSVTGFVRGIPSWFRRNYQNDDS